MKEELVFYYAHPMQVRYYKNDGYRYGIAFHEWIVDVESGEPIQTREILRRATYKNIDVDDAIIEWGGWKSLVDSIK